MKGSFLRLVVLATTSALLFGACGSSSATGTPPPGTPAAQTVLSATATPAPVPTPTPVPATQPPALGLTGAWNGAWVDTSPDTSAGTFTLTFAQTGNNLTGAIVVKGTPCITGGTVTGTVNGSTITFGAVSGRVTITYTGSVSGNKMAGTYSAPTCGDAKGNWSATQG